MKSQIRPSGGFRDAFGDELEQSASNSQAVQAASSNKQQSQQNSVLSQQAAAKQAASAGQQAGRAPRPVGTLTEELLTRPVKDIADSLKSFVDVNQILHINAEDPPEEKQRKQQMAANWQKLTAAEQEEVQRQYQANLQKKQEEQQAEEERKKKQAEAESNDSIAPPSSPQRGTQGMNAKKKASTIISNSRKLDQSGNSGAG